MSFADLMPMAFVRIDVIRGGSREVMMREGSRIRRSMVFVALISLAVSSFTSMGVAAQEATPCPPPTEEETEAIARQYFDTFNTGDLDALDALLAPDYIHRGAIGEDQDRELHKQRSRSPGPASRTRCTASRRSSPREIWW